MFSRFIHVVACVRISFQKSLSNVPLYYIPYFVYPFICQRALELLTSFGFMNNAVKNVSLFDRVLAFNSFGWINRSEIAG